MYLCTKLHKKGLFMENLETHFFQLSRALVEVFVVSGSLEFAFNSIHIGGFLKIL